MSRPPEEVPPWGTPDGTPTGATPDRGKPDHGKPDRGTPDYGTPDYGTPPEKPRSGRPRPNPGLLAADDVMLVQHGGFLSAGGYDLTTVDDNPLGSVVREATAAGLIFGGAATTTYRAFDPRGELIGTLLRPGTLGRSRFQVTDAFGAPVGRIEQENTFGPAELLLHAADGNRVRALHSRIAGGEWELADEINPVLRWGRITRGYAGLSGRISGTRQMIVRLSPHLNGRHRLLVVMAAVAIDHVSEAKRRRAGT